jgi:preprotein translocase subunit SecA
MPVSLAAAATGAVYAEREDVREGFADRLLGQTSFLVHRLFARGPRDYTLLLEEVRRQAQRLGSGAPAPRVPELRYRLRRSGLTPELAAEAFGLFACSCALSGVKDLPDAVFGAALAMTQGRLAELDNALARAVATTCAASAIAMSGVRVHLIAASDAAARSGAALATQLVAPMGLSVGNPNPSLNASARRAAYRADLVCVAYRDVAVDYLRDQLLLGGRPRRLISALDRLAGDAPAEEQLTLTGLQCALVADADAVLIDDCRLPLVVAAESDSHQERLLYEQAFELARPLGEAVDFTFEDDGIALTPSGSGRLARLTEALGGIWSGQGRREELIVLALTAMHAMQRGPDYDVANGRLVFPQPEEKPEDDTPLDARLRALLEVKEGLKLSGRRDVLARISVPRFFRRYLMMGGTCADAAGIEGELWRLYGVRAERFTYQSPLSPVCRVFEDGAGKRAALAESAARACAAGYAVVVAARTPQEGKALLEALQAQKLKVNVLQPGPDGKSPAAESGTVLLSLHPNERSVQIPPAGPVKLYVAELHDSARQIAALGRIFGAESAEHLISLDEELVRAHLGTTERVVLAASGAPEFSARSAAWVTARIQRAIERTLAGSRSDLMTTEQYLRDILAFSGIRD